MSNHSVLAAAKQAWEAGLCPIPAASDGSKAPIGRWKEYQSARPDLIGVNALFHDSCSLGLVCGEVSGRLQCLEFEGRFMQRLPEVRRALEDAGLWDEFSSWRDGYSEVTPGGGLHILVRIMGDGPTTGNTKIAISDDRETLIETRGEGGFVIVAPSGGPTHPTGKSWELLTGGFDSIAYTTEDQWEAVIDCLSQFDASPATEPPPPLPPQLRLVLPGQGWIEEALGHVPSLTDVLLDLGWTYVRTEPRGQLWRRPGKAIGHSGRINHSGRLMVFSTSTPLEVGKRTYDALDVQLAYQLGRVPTTDERTSALRRYRPEQVAGTAVGAAPVSGGETTPIVDHLNLPVEFWASRPYLQHVYLAAMSELISPDALWQAVKTFYAATVPWTFRLPSNGTMDYIGVMCGGSGAGKTLAKQLALDILPLDAFTIEGVVLGLPPGTGEGITEFFIERGKDGKATSIKNRGAGIYMDEGKWLVDVDRRAGNTTVQSMKQAWSGELTGSLAGSSERNRFLPPRAVRTAILIAIQPGIAAEFMRGDLTDGGLPQRINWSWAHYSNLPDAEHLPERPGRLDIPIYDFHSWGGGTPPNLTHEITYDPELLAQVRQRMVERRRSYSADVLEGHSDYAQLKSAAIHALMDGRMHVTLEDQELARQEWEISTRIRQHIISEHKISASDSIRAAGRASALRQLAEEEVYLEKAALRIAKRVQGADGPVKTRELKDSVSSYRQRYGVDYRAAIELAAAHGWIVAADGHSFQTGRVRL